MTESKMRWMRVIGLMILSVPTMGFLTTCGKTMDSSGLTDSQLRRVCNLWVPISWADADTDETIVEVKVNNAKNVTFCPQNKPK